MIPAAFIARSTRCRRRPRGAPALSTPGHPKVTRAGGRPGAPGQPGRAARAADSHAGRDGPPVVGLLNRDQVGLDDDFFALGGNSLLAAEMLARTRVMFGIGADLCARLPGACCAIRRCAGSPAATQDARAGRLGHGRRPGRRSTSPARRSSGPRPGADAPVACPRPDWRRPREILLTGATGFLGAHLLQRAAGQPPPRGSGAWSGRATRRDARQRIAEAAARYDLAAPARRTAWCRCPVTWPRPGWACPPANSASLPGAPTSSITRARS